MTSRQSEIRDRLADLARNYLTPTHMRNNPLIHPGLSMQSGRGLLARTHPPNNLPEEVADSEQKGNLLIWDMWY